MTDTVNAVETRGISKSFGPVVVLTDVDFDVRQGEVHALAGGNGAGKSTLMKIIQGVYQPSSGEILVRGEPAQIGSIQDAKAAGLVRLRNQSTPPQPRRTAERLVTLNRMVNDAQRLLFDAGCRIFHSANDSAIRARRKVELPLGDFDDLEMTRVELARVPAGAQEFELQYTNVWARGYQYEGADASLELLVRRSLTDYSQPFNLDDFWVIQRRRHSDADAAHNEMQAEAMVKITLFGRRPGDPDQTFQTAADGNGPVNALDAAFRKALGGTYPRIMKAIQRASKTTARTVGR